MAEKDNLRPGLQISHRLPLPRIGGYVNPTETWKPGIRGTLIDFAIAAAACEQVLVWQLDR